MTAKVKWKQRRNWKVTNKGYYSERKLCAFSKLQMSGIMAEAESRGITPIAVIRDAIDARYQLDGSHSNSRFDGE